MGVNWNADRESVFGQLDNALKEGKEVFWLADNWDASDYIDEYVEARNSQSSQQNVKIEKRELEERCLVLA